jgi:ATP-dependent RNA helicase MSS116
MSLIVKKINRINTGGAYRFLSGNFFPLQLVSFYSGKANNSKGFEQFKQLPPKLISTINEVYPNSKPTKIQKTIFEEIPIRKNLYALSSTGSGKTLAYLIPNILTMLQNLSPNQILKGKQVSILILVPTRELAFQVSKEAKKLLKYYPFQVLSLVGGSGRLDDTKKVLERRVDLVVGTPGRVLDLITGSQIFRHQLQYCKTLILDECDQLLAEPFLPTTKSIIKNINNKPKLMLFSATESKKLKIELGIKEENFKIINLKDSEEFDKPRIFFEYLVAPHNLHHHLVYSILNSHRKDKIILFLPTVISCKLFSEWLTSLNFNTLSLHGQMCQTERAKISAKFKEASSGVLITTDLSSRGLDYPEVDIVLQWAIPTSVNQFIHRSGRTGRMGKTGSSILLLSPYEEQFINLIRQQAPEIQLKIIDVAKKYPKPSSPKLHRINKKLDSIKAGLIKEWYRGMLKYYWTLPSSLGFDNRKESVKLVSSWMISLGFEVPKLSGRLRENQ